MLRIGSTRSALLASSRVTPVSKRSISLLHHSRTTTPTSVPNRYVVATSEASTSIPARSFFVLQRAPFATRSSNGFQKGIDIEEEKKIAQRKLEPHPESVTTESSVRPLFEPSEPSKERPLADGITDDLKTVQDTFSLSDAPKEPYWLGLAGTLPYLGTSISTVYLAWVLNTTWPTSSTIANNLLISPETASWLLATLEPIQLGYGAVIISFLGAVHWGLEYAEKAPSYSRTRFRYGMGVMASIVAWPTLLLPVEFALTTQFAAFVALYFADAKAAVRGWAPVWYGTYRFALTAVVGVAIAISLIGRAKVGDASPRLTGLSEKFHERRGEEDYTQKWQDLEQRDIKKAKEEEKAAQKEKEKKKKREDAKAKDERKSSGDEKGKQGGGAENNNKEEEGTAQEGNEKKKKEEEKAAQKGNEKKKKEGEAKTKEEGQSNEDGDEDGEEEAGEGKSEKK